ncbi:Uncharacterized protein HZ326_5792 [Fusarium oxysporum f. sp. albedinis]|nr:Uncharacterized protein HZ326_5792 [Fusarium oxysporum f. sp. albedinis]
MSQWMMPRLKIRQFFTTTKTWMMPIGQRSWEIQTWIRNQQEEGGMSIAAGLGLGLELVFFAISSPVLRCNCTALKNHAYTEVAIHIFDEAEDIYNREYKYENETMSWQIDFTWVPRLENCGRKHDAERSRC